MKSAYELAMERLDKQHGKVAPLNDKQKEALAEIDRRCQARLAEIEILYRDRIGQARAVGDVETMRRLEEESQTETARTRSRSDEEKEAVRRDAGLA